jgi:hypothetical protein
VIPEAPLPRGWEVVAADGFCALFLDRARAEQYAVNCHGVVHPLYRKEDPWTTLTKTS